ncbi:MAG: aspartate aminotransferase [Myxococcales bacterium]|nr:aspartate aminotransferase [Myxococcales bacterium]
MSGSFRAVPRTGVIFVSSEASKRGFYRGAPDWCNLGQGQPETGPLGVGDVRIDSIAIDEADHEYAPVAGLQALRAAVANLYNHRYRRGKKSQYGPENVAISGGGRAGLTRAAAALGRINLGHFLPDYTAYEELLEIFGRFSSIPILLEAEQNYDFGIPALRREILGRGLGGLLLSNPCNPTGKMIHGDELAAWVETARTLDCALLVDEFYSNYTWACEGPVSAAAFVDDVNEDPVILVDGLTKNWRYPGWRISWTVGPQSVIEAITSAGSFLDGGANRPLQRAALSLLEPARAEGERERIRSCFLGKRQRMIDGLRRLGVKVGLEPEGTFYVWGDLSEMPEGLREGMAFFQACLDEKVIVVPGEFFDVNPGKRRPGRHSRFRNQVRFSFGPELSVIDEGLLRMERLLSR